MPIIAKTFATLLSITVIARSVVDYKNKKESLQMTVFWIVIWLVILVFAFFPNSIDQLIRAFGGDKTGLGTIFGMAIIFVIFICYRIYVKANRIEKNLEVISRKYALSELEQKKDRKINPASRR